uniref:F-box domain-containing protein n=1 Tax=Amaranthus palmeri TaxID=107608 RepID=A0A6C0T4Z5_AMAPA|nr:hypothetical protein AP_R.00g000040-v1.0.a3 [Amaranthus palmeri]
MDICSRLEGDNIYGKKMDRISRLPDEILVPILDYLPTDCAVSTSILSTRWRYLFQLTTNLRFDDERLDLEVVVGGTSTAQNFFRKIRFKKFVYDVLGSHQVSAIKLFSLKTHLNPYRLHPYNWINAAIHKQVQELYLRFEADEDLENSPWYNLCSFPCDLFNSKTLVVLQIGFLTRQEEFFLLLEVLTSISLPNLKNLHLKCITFCDSKSCKRFFSGCFSLEELTLENCRIRARDSMHSTTLKKLTIINMAHEDWIDIHASSLAYLTIITPGDYGLSSINKLASALVTHIHSVTHFSLLGETLMGRYYGLPNFPNVAWLELGPFDFNAWNFAADYTPPRHRHRPVGWFLFKLRNSLFIGTLEAKSLELANELSKYRIHVACVQETRWKGRKAKSIKGYKLWYAGLDGKRSGVGILVSNVILEQVVEVRRCNDRMMLVRIVVGEEVVSFVSAYGPQVGLDDQVKREFLDNLGALLSSIPEDEKIFLGGDFNGHIGRDAGTYNSVHGGFGLGARNESGEFLLEFALARDLVVANSLFRKKDEHLITYKSGGHATQVDYFLVRKVDRSSCLDCKVVLGTEMPTQHRLLVMVFRMRKKIAEKKAELRGKIMWGRLKGDVATTLANRISDLGFPSQSEDAYDMWVNMANTIRGVAKETLGVASGKPKVYREAWWWNEEVEKIIKDKNKSFRDLMACTEEEARAEKRRSYKEAKKAAKKAVIEVKNRAYEEFYQKLDSKEGEKDIFKLARARAMQHRDLEAVKYIKDEGGRVLLRQEEIKTRWRKYFSDLLNEYRGPRGDDSRTFDAHRPSIFGLACAITPEEVKEALKKMGRSKAVGPNNIPIEVWKGLGDEGIRWLTNLFNVILRTHKMPEEWRSSTIIPLFKNKGDAQECGNYRGIKLLSHTMKLWERVIERKIRQEAVIRENQFGFMPGRSTMEAIHVLRRLMEKYRDRKKDLHMIFIDLEKAYDSIPRQVIWDSLKAKGISSIYIEIIRDMYDNVSTNIQTPVGLTEAFPVKVGLHQGSALSPFIFAIIMDEISKSIWETVLWCMLFADDIVLVAESKEEVNNKLDEWRASLEVLDVFV